ncbi:Calx-beta domain-containing protein [Methylobacterium frigidaeris]|uniref:Calx-beta domain-containing protein n=1 Tax=Methylobacterium frigidaeris TaxID=2038277 RepID=A0AA37M882_9HYPH|nr:Calx-beta domain-containing protein [Methylobacterium frigidaeris]GJD66820.1 hypothetical protein MPEAHAMD_7019 [Methylobacterium frigidaeris]
MAALPTVKIEMTDGLATEAVAGDGLTFVLTRDGDLSGPLTVTTGVSSGNTPNSATPGQDFVSPPGTVTFEPGSAKATLALTVIDDTLVEASLEGLSVNILPGTGYQLGYGGTTSAYAVIRDNDSDPQPLPLVGLRATDAVATEGVPGDGLSFTLTRGGDLSKALTVNITVGGAGDTRSPTSSDDLGPTPRTITFQPGSDTAVLDVSVVDDLRIEPEERLIVMILDGEGYQIGSPLGNVADAPTFYANGTIKDNDVLPFISITATVGTAKEGALDGGLSFTLKRTGDISRPLTVSTFTENATIGRPTATSGLDYVPVPSSVTFQAGSNTAILDVSVIDDDVVEPDEYFTVGMSGGVEFGSGYYTSPLSYEPGRYSTGGQYPATVTASIVDNDVAPPNRFLVGDASDNRLLAGNGNDEVLGGAGDDIIFGELGNDILKGESGNDFIGGGAGNDFISGGEGDDVLFGEDGADFMFGDTGNDRMTLGLGDDNALGGAGNDTLFGEGGDDLINGEEGDDFIGAGAGNDQLSGGAGNDALYGEGGEDVLFGNAGDDVLVGGGGQDRFAFGRGDGRDLIRDFVTGGSEADVIAFNGGAFADFGAVTAALRQDGADAVIGYGSGDEVRLQNVQTSSLSAANFTFT